MAKRKLEAYGLTPDWDGEIEDEQLGKRTDPTLLLAKQHIEDATELLHEYFKEGPIIVECQCGALNEDQWNYCPYCGRGRTDD